MGTIITPEISRDKRWHISKHRYYELKHFCLQYYEWKLEYENEGYLKSPNLYSERVQKGGISFPTETAAVRASQLSIYMELVEETAKEADKEIGSYIFSAVTEDLSFTLLKTRYLIPCERGMYYDRYRKFFWILDKKRM